MHAHSQGILTAPPTGDNVISLWYALEGACVHVHLLGYGVFIGAEIAASLGAVASV